MEKEVCSVTNRYTRPLVVSHQPVRFETAHSWNRGVGRKISDDGNPKYPHDPRPSKKH